MVWRNLYCCWRKAKVMLILKEIDDIQKKILTDKDLQKKSQTKGYLLSSIYAG